jgi:hypothetical protein
MIDSLEPKKFLMFLNFLKFITNLDYKTEIFDGDSYRIIIFRVKDILDVCYSYYNSQDPGQKGGPDTIVAIVKRSRLDNLMKTFKNKFD